MDRRRRLTHPHTPDQRLGAPIGVIDPTPIHSSLSLSACFSLKASDAAQQAGVTEQELLSQLSQNLPQFVDKLTANGRIPSLQEIAGALLQK